MIAYIQSNWSWLAVLAWTVINEIVAGSPLKSNSNVQLILSWVGYLIKPLLGAVAPAPSAPAPASQPPAA